MIWQTAKLKCVHYCKKKKKKNIYIYIYKSFNTGNTGFEIGIYKFVIEMSTNKNVPVKDPFQIS